MALTASVRGIFALQPNATRSAEQVTALKRPLPAFFIAAARALPDAFIAFDLCMPFLRLPPGYLTFFAFFFFFFFFFFLAFFFFFFFFFAFLAFFGFFAGFFAAFFFFAAV